MVLELLRDRMFFFKKIATIVLYLPAVQHQNGHTQSTHCLFQRENFNITKLFLAQ